MESLTIAIPTFNRHDKLLRTLNILHKIKDHYSINVIIIDNCSTPPVFQYLEEHNYPGFDYTHVYRNNGNVGMCANILLCFVYCVSEWMWLLGDDDPPLSNCLNDIFDEIRKAKENDFLIKFNTHAGNFPEQDLTISNEREFIRFCDNFSYYSNMLFMSNSIYRANTMQKYLRVMFEFNNTLAPFIIGILKSLSEYKCIRIVNRYIIEHGRVAPGETWDQHKVREGVLYFNDLRDHKEFKMVMVRSLFRHYFTSTRRFYLPVFIYPFRYNYSSEYWSWFYYKSSGIFNGTKSLYLRFLSKAVNYYYNSMIINRLIKKKIKTITLPNFERS